MKRIEAVIRPQMLEPLRIHLEELKYPGMMVTEIEGHGKQRGMEQQWRGTHYKQPYLPKVKIEIVVPESMVNKLTKAITEVCRSGKVGDGKIFISSVTNAIRIRTMEKGDKALK